MYEVNDIVKMLEEGQSADEIAKSFTDVMNKAIREKEEKDSKKKMEEVYQKAMRDDMYNIVKTVKIYMENYYPTEWKKEFADVDLSNPELLDDMISQVDKYVQLHKNITAFIDTMFPKVKAEEEDAAATKPDLSTDSFKDPFDNFEDIFSDFFKKNGIK